MSFTFVLILNTFVYKLYLGSDNKMLNLRENINVVILIMVKYT